MSIRRDLGWRHRLSRGQARRGAADAGAVSSGFNIGLPQEQAPDAFSTPELTFRFHDVARLLHFADTPEATWEALLDAGLTPGREPAWQAARDVHR
jgi:hypothetical protein